MKRPTWAIVVGVFMILIGGCSALDNFTETKTSQFQKESSKAINELDFEEIDDEAQREEFDSTNLRIIETFGDSVVRDSTDQIDVKATMDQLLKMSDYRIKWMERFGYVGLFIAVLFIISGIFFLSQKKYTIPIAIGTLALSLLAGVFELFIYMSDDASSNMISQFGNIGIYLSIFIDIILLITVMVLDKTYFNADNVVYND